MNKVLNGGIIMVSRYTDRFRMGNAGSTKNLDIRHVQTNDNVKLMENLTVEVAREIRNPLTSIKGFIQLLKMGVSKPEYYSMIDSEINKVEEIVNRLIKIAETQSVSFRINDIRLILERAIMRMNDLALLKGIKITSSLEGGFLSNYCDQIQLQQAFENIIKNSI